MDYFVVGDVAGEYDTLIALLDKATKDIQLVCLGDPNDRGLKSKETIEYLINNSITVQSNHAHMMTEAWYYSANPESRALYYPTDIWPKHNGGLYTVQSYGDFTTPIHKLIPESHIRFLENCPLYYEFDNFICTHAPVHIRLNKESIKNIGTGFLYRFDQISEDCVLWNRQVPSKPNRNFNNKINLFGHNAYRDVKAFTTEFPNGVFCDQKKLNELLDKREEYPIYAIGLDTSVSKILTGLHIPTMTIYQQEYV